jgi:peptide/nickel transport system substrate-binding protein
MAGGSKEDLMRRQRRRPLHLAAVSLAFALVVAACGGGGGGGGNGSSGTAIKDGGTLSYAADQEPTGFNNNTSKDNGTSVLNVVINMFPPVFRLHPDYSIQLNKELMDSATQTSTDPLTIVYKIRQEAVWSDGTPVSADDFVYLWKNLNGSIKGNDVAATTGYDQIQSVKGSDNGKTVTVVFSEPFSDWKSLFYGLLPAHYMAKVPGGWNTGLDKNPEKIPVNGPYRIASWDQGQSLTLARNDQYYGPKAHLDKLVFRFLPESTTQPAALQNDEVDLIYPQPQLDMVAQVKALPDVTSELNIGLSFEHLDFNFKNPHLANANVRKAIATGLNIRQLVDRTVKQFTDKAQPLGNRIWLPGQKPYQDHFGQYGKGDAAAATKLLEDAGYTKGADGIYAKDGQKLSLRISTTAGNQLRETQEELIQAQMKQIGVDIRLANADSRKLFGDWLPNGNFDIANFGWVGNPFAVSSSQDLYRTGGGGNYGAYSSKKVDELFSRGVREVDEAKSAELSNQIDQQLTADMATIPLYAKPTYLAVRDSFANVGDNATQEGPFWNSSLWAQKAT